MVDLLLTHMLLNSSTNFVSIQSHDSAYPPLLRQISDAPKRLFASGQLLDPHDSYIAIVGTRRTGPYGKKIAHDFAVVLARCGFVIVSGLALGIDTAAHAAALHAGGKTIAVLGSGLNTITPPCNVGLAE